MKIHESQIVGDLVVDSDISVGGNIINKDLSQSLQSILQAMDGYGGGTPGGVTEGTYNSFRTEYSQTIHDIVSACDGYGGASPGAVTATQGYDGYLAFFTAGTTIAGDNDLYWDRGNNRLVVREIKVDGYLSVQENIVITGQAASLLRNAHVPNGTTLTIDFNTGNSQTIDLAEATGDVTLVFVNAIRGGSYVLEIIQDVAVPRDLVWPISVKWPDSVTPVISTGASAVDICSLFFNGTSFYANIGQSYG